MTSFKNLSVLLCLIVLHAPIQADDWVHATNALRFASGDHAVLSICYDLNDPMLQQEPYASLKHFQEISNESELAIVVISGQERIYASFSNRELIPVADEWTPDELDVVVRFFEEEVGRLLVIVSENHRLYFNVNEEQLCYAGAPILIN